MRMLTVAAGAAFLFLAVGTARAGDPRLGEPGCCHGGRGHVDAFASYFNARAYDVEGVRRDGRAGAVVYVGGYGEEFFGDPGPHYYGPIATAGPACPSAPFGYVVTGFGRDDFRPSRCGYRGHDIHDRGGRYGYSARRGSTYDSYESYDAYEAYGAWETGRATEVYDRRRDCDCRSDRPPAPYPPPYLPEPPRYEPPRHERPRSHRPERPRRAPPPRQEYRQEPGERG